MSVRGFFITIEGGEGVGKSTNLTLLKEYISDHGVELIVTREPGGTPLGEDIRALLLGSRPTPIDSLAELLLIFAARAQHIHEVIEPALRDGKWVLCDRFTDATYAYQCGGRGLDPATVVSLEKLVQKNLRPDFTLLLDAPIDVGLSRARDRGALDRFEQESQEFFERVRASYLELAKGNADRYSVVDVARPLIDVQRDIHEFASEVLEAWSRGNRPL